MKKRILENQSTGNRCIIEHDGTRVKIGSGIPGKEKFTEKQCENNETAWSHAEKEQWARLKKGFILNQPMAEAGEPRMHRYLGDGLYTGALAIERFGQNILVNHQSKEDNRDHLLIIDENASLLESIPLPESTGIAWEVKQLNQDELLINIDHRIWRLSLNTRRYERLTERGETPASFLSVRGNVAAWYAPPAIVVHDVNLHSELFRQEVKPELHGGHSPQLCAELSPDGKMLAYCVRAGEIVIYDITQRQQKSLFKDSLKMITKLAFTADGHYLIALEKYGSWAVYCFDLLSMESPRIFPHQSNGPVSDFAVDDEGNRVAICSRNYVDIFDSYSFEHYFAFTVEHVVKDCSIRYFGRDIGAHTDCGCASLYALGS